MIHENIEGAALKLRSLAGLVQEPVWEEIRSAVRVLDQAAADARSLECQVCLSRSLANIVRALPESTTNH